ncbi:hypothetical protein VAWG006_11520 [Aeromonas enteropelogenes]|uniref:CopG family transcriptional regulator n=1 Tax=Aeromonas sp. 19NY04SH05-1 TaxID=2920537 RepID=A0AAU6TBR9_9GAMM|nr:hypothetical protein VAWG006_11520 [Aeromonas enteropelogenes]BEE21062.1 hypothetical protein VAWG007_11570 [Aeromonas enteropelogenes]
MRLELELGRRADENLKVIMQSTNKSAQSFLRQLVTNVPAAELLKLLSSYQENQCKTTNKTNN